jgi:RNA polymerase sigma-70 factor (ECF subfamily)
MLCLEEQDRSSWNQSTVRRGMWHLAHSAAGEELTEYHLQAGIAACHCAAPDYASTNWRQILSLYDQLMELDDSPIVALNRAVVVAKVHGASAGIKAVEAIQNPQTLKSYYLFYAVLAEFETQLNNGRAAAQYLRKAIQLTEVKAEHALLSRRLRDCEEPKLASERT